MLHLFLLFACIISNLFARAGEIRYPVHTIPEKLLKKADVVKRFEEIRLEIVNPGEAMYRKKLALTILNENGEREASLSEYYDKLRKVVSLEGNLYNANGELVRKMKNREVVDLSATSAGNLFDDSRMKVFEFNYHAYPYTVEYEVVIKFNTTYILPEWLPQDEEDLSVEYSSYTFVAPLNYEVRFKSFNYNTEVITATTKNKRSYTWKVTALPAIQRPYASPVWNELTTAVYFAPSTFELEGYKGKGSTWKDLGKFQALLNAGRDKLPSDIADKVKEMTAGITDPKEKVKILYSYLQNNTRYISIQRGIGGMQPFDASYVARKGYGDCKALSNYMYSLLKAAGIRSYYAWVRAGRQAEDKYLAEDFPSDCFNHIILCVPFEKDTMWLECTSQTESPGYMGGFTGDRKALLITEDGGVLAATPRYGLKENVQLRSIKASIREDGSLDMKVETKYTGMEQDVMSELVDYSKDKVKKFLREELGLSTYEVNDFRYEQKKAMLPEVQEKLDISVSNYATITGKRLFIAPNILAHNESGLSEEERTVDFVFSYEFHDEDNEEIEIPEGYIIESAPQDVNIKTKYGSYSSSAKLIGNKIIYHRVREQFAGRFPAAEQAAIVQFFTDIYKADRSKIVLIRKEN